MDASTFLGRDALPCDSVNLASLFDHADAVSLRELVKSRGGWPIALCGVGAGLSQSIDQISLRKGWLTKKVDQ